MENVISIVTTLIGCITLFVKTFFGKSLKREKQYYENVLRPYVLELSKNKKLSTISMVEGLVNRNDDDIPKYIFYLLDNGQEEKLNKVLIYDYWTLYPNDDNTVYKVVDGFMKLLYYLLFFMSLYLLVFGILYFINGFSGAFLLLSDLIRNEIIDGGVVKGVKDVLREFLISVFCFGFGVGTIRINAFMNEDRYDIKTKKIIAMIKRRIKKYDKSSYKFMI